MLLGKFQLPIEEIIDYDSNLPSVPPSATYLPIMGKLTISLKLDYLNLPFDKNFQFRYALWGSQSKIYFLKDKTELKITASIESLSKYFWDMNALCIEVLSAHQTGTDVTLLSRKNLGKTEKELADKDKKIVGFVFVPLRKYFINHVMNSFSGQRFVIMDQNKKRIGQLESDLIIEMLSNNGLQYKQYIALHNKQSEHSLIGQSKQAQRERDEISLMNQITSNRFPIYQVQEAPKKKKVTISDQNKVINQIENGQTTKNPQKTQKSLVQNKYLKKNYFSHQNIYLGGSQNNIPGDTDSEERENQENSKTHINQTNSINKIGGTKHSIKKSHDLDPYLSKPQHTALSMIKMKYGSNHPALELMKLRLDEVKYIDKEAAVASQNDMLINHSGKFNLKFLIKSLSIITGRSTTHPKSLTIASFTSHHKMLTRTELSLESLPKNNELIQMNSVVACNNVSLNDKMVIETADAFDELTVKEFMKQQIVDLRRKDNKKRAYEIKYEIWQDQVHTDQQGLNRDVSAGSLKYRQLKRQERQISRSGSPKGVLKKTKQINKIINNHQDSTKQQSSKNKLPKSKPGQLIAQRQNGQRAPTQSIKSPYHKLLKQSSENLFKNNSEKNNQFTTEELLNSVIHYFQLLYRCEDENCLGIVNRLSSRNNIDMIGSEREKLYSKLSTILIGQSQKQNNLQIIPLQTIVNRLFLNNFIDFYRTFTSYKEINLKYTTTIFKLTRLLHFYQQLNKNDIEHQYSQLEKIYAVLEYVKKYKRQHISFGLISYIQLQDIILQKYNTFTEVNNEQLNSRLSNVINEKQPQHEGQRQQQANRQNDPEQIRNLKTDELQQLISSLLILFCRHQGEFIKIVQLQQFISSTIKNNKLQNQSTPIDLNLNLLTLLHKEVIGSESQVQTQINQLEQFLKSPIFEFINQHIKEFNIIEYAKRNMIEEQQYQKSNRLTLYELIYKDILSLSDLKSSIHLSLLNSQHFTSRSRTQPHQHNNILKTQQQPNQLKYPPKYNYQKNRLNTEEISLNNHDKKRLDTEDINLIDLVNDNQKINPDHRQKSIFTKEEEIIGIQVTKKQEFRREQITKTLHQNQNIYKKIKQTNEQRAQQTEQKAQQTQQNPSGKHFTQNEHIRRETPDTNYISIRCTLINPLANTSNKKHSYPYHKPPLQTITLFYQHTEPQDGNKKAEIQQYKIEAKSYDSRQTIVPNTFNVIEGRKSTMQQVGFRLENLQPNHPSLIKVKNIIGRQQYAIQNNEGKLSFVLQVQIQPLNQEQQKQYLQQEKLKLQLQNRQFQTDKFSRLFILNLNKLFSLDLFDLTDTFRVIYERNSQLVAVRDISKANIQQHSYYPDLATVHKSRVIALDTQFIGIQPSLSTQQKHTLKIVKMQSSNSQSQNSKPIQLNTAYKPDIRTKKSQSINRSYDNRHQGTFTHSKQSPCDLLAQFQFSLKISPRKHDLYGIKKQTKWLIHDKFRLQIDLFDVKYQKWQNNDQDEGFGSNGNQADKQSVKMSQNQQIWDKKILKILTVFNHQNQSTIQNHYQSISRLNQNHQQVTFQSFIQLIASSMKYRLTETQIFTSLCFINSKSYESQLDQNHKFMYLLSLFAIDQANLVDFSNCEKKSSINNLLSLYEEFQTFDLEHTGSLTPFKYQVIKKVIPELILIQNASFIIGKSLMPQLQHLTQTQTIKDIKVTPQIQKNLDYLKILWTLKNNYKDDFFDILPQKVIIKNQNTQSNKLKPQSRKKQPSEKKIEQENQIDLQWENEEYESEYKKQINKRPFKVPIKQVDSLLKRQFYEQDLSDEQQDENDRKPIQTKKKGHQLIGKSVLQALNNESQQKRLLVEIQNRIKGNRQENLLSQTRQQWQMRKNTSLNNKQQSVQDDNGRSLVNVMKEQIEKQELEKKFTAIKHMDFSSSESEDQ